MANLDPSQNNNSPIDFSDIVAKYNKTQPQSSNGVQPPAGGNSTSNNNPPIDFSDIVAKYNNQAPQQPQSGSQAISGFAPPPGMPPLRGLLGTPNPDDGDVTIVPDSTPFQSPKAGKRKQQSAPAFSMTPSTGSTRSDLIARAVALHNNPVLGQSDPQHLKALTDVLSYLAAAPATGFFGKFPVSVTQPPAPTIPRAPGLGGALLGYQAQITPPQGGYNQAMAGLNLGHQSAPMQAGVGLLLPSWATQQPVNPSVISQAATGLDLGHQGAIEDQPISTTAPNWHPGRGMMFGEGQGYNLPEGYNPATPISNVAQALEQHGADFLASAIKHGGGHGFEEPMSYAKQFDPETQLGSRDIQMAGQFGRSINTAHKLVAQNIDTSNPIGKTTATIAHGLIEAVNQTPAVLDPIQRVAFPLQILSNIPESVQYVGNAMNDLASGDPQKMGVAAIQVAGLLMLARHGLHAGSDIAIDSALKSRGLTPEQIDGAKTILGEANDYAKQHGMVVDASGQVVPVTAPTGRVAQLIGNIRSKYSPLFRFNQLSGIGDRLGEATEPTQSSNQAPVEAGTAESPLGPQSAPVTQPTTPAETGTAESPLGPQSAPVQGFQTDTAGFLAHNTWQSEAQRLLDQMPQLRQEANARGEGRTTSSQLRKMEQDLRRGLATGVAPDWLLDQLSDEYRNTPQITQHSLTITPSSPIEGASPSVTFAHENWSTLGQALVEHAERTGDPNLGFIRSQAEISARQGRPTPELITAIADWHADLNPTPEHLAAIISSMNPDELAKMQRNIGVNNGTELNAAIQHNTTQSATTSEAGTGEPSPEGGKTNAVAGANAKPAPNDQGGEALNGEPTAVTTGAGDATKPRPVIPAPESTTGATTEPTATPAANPASANEPTGGATAIATRPTTEAVTEHEGQTDYITGARKSVTSAERAARGLSPVSMQEYSMPQHEYEPARQAIMKGEIHPTELAEEVANKPRNLTHLELNALVYHRATLIEEYNANVRATAEHSDPNTIAELKARNELLSHQLDINEQALTRSGRVTSAALNARKLMIKPDYSPAVVNGLAAQAKGQPLTPEERAKADKVGQENVEAKQKLQDAKAKQDEVKAQRVAKKAESLPIDVNRDTIEQLKAELRKNAEEFRKKGGNPRGPEAGQALLGPEFLEYAGKQTSILGQIVKEYVKAGIGTVDRLLRELTKEGITELVGRPVDKATVKRLLASDAKFTVFDKGALRYKPSVLGEFEDLLPQQQQDIESLKAYGKAALAKVLTQDSKLPLENQKVAPALKRVVGDILAQGQVGDTRLVETELDKLDINLDRSDLKQFLKGQGSTVGALGNIYKRPLGEASLTMFAGERLAGFNELWKRALDAHSNGDTATFDTIARHITDRTQAFMDHVFAGTGIEAKVSHGFGTFQGDFEPSIRAEIHIPGSMSNAEAMQIVEARLAHIGQSTSQKNIYMRTDVHPDTPIGDTGEHGVTIEPQYEIELTRPVTNEEYNQAVEQSGLQAGSLTNDRKSILVHGLGETDATKDEFARKVRTLIKALHDQGLHGRTTAGTIELRNLGSSDAEVGGFGNPRNPEAFRSYKDIISGASPEQKFSGSALNGPRDNVWIRKDINATFRRFISSVKGLADDSVGTDSVPDNISYKRTPKGTEQQYNVADHFDAMPQDDTHPYVKKAYKELVDELDQQWRSLNLRVEFMPKGEDGNMSDYYGTDSKKVFQDIRDNNHLYIFPTEEGYGEEGQGESKNPLLEQSPYKTADGKPMLWNDVLRAVHDAIAHGAYGASFGPNGEELAFVTHALVTKSPWAIWALATETRGQNSWVNFGPQVRDASGKLLPEGERPAKADLKYADQKSGLLPVDDLKTGIPEIDNKIKTLPTDYNSATGDKPATNVEPDGFKSVADSKTPAGSLDASERVKQKATPRVATKEDLEPHLRQGKTPVNIHMADRTMVGTYVDPKTGATAELHGGSDYPLQPDKLGKVAWAVEKPGFRLATHDNPGLVIMYAGGKDTHLGGQGYDVAAAIIKKAVELNKITEQEAVDQYNKAISATDAARSAKLPKAETLDDVLNGLANYKSTSFQSRTATMKSLFHKDWTKAKGLSNWEEIRDGMEDPRAKKYAPGDILTLLHVDPDAESTSAEEAGVEKHPVYSYVIKGTSLGHVPEGHSIVTLVPEHFATKTYSRGGKSLGGRSNYAMVDTDRLSQVVEPNPDIAGERARIAENEKLNQQKERAEKNAPEVPVEPPKIKSLVADFLSEVKQHYEDIGRNQSAPRIKREGGHASIFNDMAILGAKTAYSLGKLVVGVAKLGFNSLDELLTNVNEELKDHDIQITKRLLTQVLNEHGPNVLAEHTNDLRKKAILEAAKNAKFGDTLSAIADQVRQQHPDTTIDHVVDALAPKPGEPNPPTETQKAQTDLRKQAAIQRRINDFQNGVKPTKTPAPEASPALQAIREQEAVVKGGVKRATLQSAKAGKFNVDEILADVQKDFPDATRSDVMSALKDKAKDTKALTPEQLNINKAKKIATLTGKTEEINEAVANQTYTKPEAKAKEEKAVDADVAKAEFEYKQAQDRANRFIKSQEITPKATAVRQKLRAMMVSSFGIPLKVGTSFLMKSAADTVGALPAKAYDNLFKQVTGVQGVDISSLSHVKAGLENAKTKFSINRLINILKGEESPSADVETSFHRINSGKGKLTKATDVAANAIFGTHSALYSPLLDYGQGKAASELSSLYAKNFPGQQLAPEQVRANMPEELAKKAKTEGQEGILMNPNVLANAWMNERPLNSTAMGQIAGIGSTLLLPTPGVSFNSFGRFLEHTPLGFGKTAIEQAGAIKNAKLARTLAASGDMEGANAARLQAMFKQREASKTFGRAAVGTVGLVTLGYVLAKNGYLSGLYNKDTNESAPTHGVIHVGPIDWNIEESPVGKVMALGALWAEAEKNAPSDPEQWLMNVLTANAKHWASELTLNAIAEAFPLTSPARTINNLRTPGGREKDLEQFGSEAIPGAVKSIAKGLDYGNERQANTLPEKLQSGIPILRNQLPLKPKTGQ